MNLEIDLSQQCFEKAQAGIYLSGKHTEWIINQGQARLTLSYHSVGYCPKPCVGFG